MAFWSNILLLLFYYLRPQDWVPGMSGFNMAKLAVAGGVLGLMQRGRSDPKWKFMSTPHEWVMVIFLFYTAFTSHDFWGVMTDLGSLVVFAFLALHALTTERLLERYMQWWLAALIGIMIMATLTRLGLDICSSRALIDLVEGRLCLQTFTMNNPNAMGHTLVVALPMAYHLWVKNNTVANRLYGMFIMLLGASTVAATQSKGAYVAGAVSFIGAYMFGRKLIFQILVGVVVVTLSGSVVAFLPRMDKVKQLSTEEGVQGRMMAWAIARTTTRTLPTGAGYKEFHAWIRWEGVLDDKSPHSSFVHVAGDLGVTGLTIYLAMLLVSGRSVVQYPGLTPEMSRSRGTLLSILLGLLVSGWFLDRAFYTEVFVFVGASAAYHQLAVRARREAALLELQAEAAQEDKEIVPHGLPASAMKAAHEPIRWLAMDDEPAKPVQEIKDLGEVRVPGIWTRLGLLDVAMAVAAGQLALQVWDFAMETLKP